MLTDYIILDCDGQLPLGAAEAYAESHGKKLAGIQRYLIGNPAASLCVYAGSSIALNDGLGVRGWLDGMRKAGKAVIYNFELSANAPDGGVAQAESDGPLIAECMRVLPAPHEAFVSNDAMVSNPHAVVEYYARIVEILRSSGVKTCIYGQASVYEQVRGVGVEYLWKAPDGTQDEPPGTLMVQQYPPVTVNWNGGTWNCDVNILTDEGVKHWVKAPDPIPKGECDVNMPILKYGESSDHVRSLKGALLATPGPNGQCWGSEEGMTATNGDFNDVLLTVVHNFQNAHGIKPADHFGQECWEQLWLGKHT